MKISIIIPAYNVEKYIGNCLDSIFNQKVEKGELEVIVINDGSRDGTESIIRQYKSEHPNLVYYSQENQGQSVARNAGLKIATGNYVWYVDSDDAITEDSIQTVFSYIEKYPNADFLTFDNIYYDYQSGERHYSRSWGGRKVKGTPYDKKYSGKEASEVFRSVVPWYHVFKTDFLISNNLYFIPGLIHEDNEFTLRIFFFAKEVRFIPFAHYIYTGMRPGSITAESVSYSLKSAEDKIKTIEVWKAFERKNAKTKEQKKFINKAVNHTYRSLILFGSRIFENSDVYILFQKNRKEWRQGYIDSFKNSFSLISFSWVELVRFFITLYFPKCYKYTEARTYKRLLRRANLFL